MTWARLADGLPHESAVADRIAATGWLVAPFGQGILTDVARDALRVWDTDLRWMPDLLCARPRTDTSPIGDCVRLVDAKWSKRQDTPNYAFEQRSVAAHHRWIVGFGHHVWLVFYDMRCCRVADALADPQLRRGTWHGSGSGTPFYLLPKVSPCVADVDVAFDRGRGES